MCTTSLEKPELQIAEEDIKVYKFVLKIKTVRYGLFGLKKKEFFKSFHERFIYRQGKVYKTELDEFKRSGFYFPVYESRRGFYSYEIPDNYDNVECIIPKGAKYYRAYDINRKEWVYTSDKIKIIKSI